MSLELSVCIGWAARQVMERSICLGCEGATERAANAASGASFCVADALAAMADWQLPDGQPLGPQLHSFRTSVWGKPASAKAPLKSGDRLELVRALRVDPKVARRERFAQQGSRSAGLFSKKRPNGKAGY